MKKLLIMVMFLQITTIWFTVVNYEETKAITHDDLPSLETLKTVERVNYSLPTNQEPEVMKVIEEPKVKTDDDIYNDIIAGNPYKEYIYYHETSFGSPYYTIHDSVQMYNNSTNVYGICQLSLDYYDISGYPNFYNSVYSQDEACTDYMESRYGTWENAYYFHLENGWW